MAEFKSSFATAMANFRGGAIQGAPNASHVQRQRKIARFVYNTAGTEAQDDTILLGEINEDGARIDVENTKIRFGGAGAFSASVKLQRVRAGSATDLSAALATTAAAVGAFAVAGIGPQTDCLKGDQIRLLITAVTSITAPKQLDVEMPYDVPTL